MFASERRPSNKPDSSVSKKKSKKGKQSEDDVALEQPPVSMNLLGQKGAMTGWSRETAVENSESALKQESEVGTRACEQQQQDEAEKSQTLSQVPLGIGEVKTEEQITGQTDWTTEDRTSNSVRWQAACLYNLENGNSAVYVRIEQRRDFYRWFYNYHAERGWETRWALAASIVANGAHQVAYPPMESWAETLGPMSDELQAFMRLGNQVIFDNVFPKLMELHSCGPLKGWKALEWDMQVLSEEQQLIQPLYESASPQVVKQLEQIAKKDHWTVRAASWTDRDNVEEGKHNQAGEVPAFPKKESIESVDARWHYGMELGNLFAPKGTGYNSTLHRPETSEEYTSGKALAKVNVRSNLHMLDANLDYGESEIPRGVKGIPTSSMSDSLRERLMIIPNLLQKLTPPEKEELARDRSPDGFRYSERLSRFAVQRSDIEAALPASGEAQKAFLQNLDQCDSFLGQFPLFSNCEDKVD